MLIYLPQSLQGLSQMREKILQLPISYILSQLNGATVDLSLPKFRIESTFDLVQPLKKVNLKKIILTPRQ